MSIRQRLLLIVALPIVFSLMQWGLSHWARYQAEQHKAMHAVESQIAGYAIQLALLSREVGIDLSNPRPRDQWSAINQRIDRLLASTRAFEPEYVHDTLVRLRMLRASFQRLLDEPAPAAVEDRLARARRDRHVDTLGLHASALAEDSLAAGRSAHTGFERSREVIETTNRALTAVGALIVVLAVWLLGRDILRSIRTLGANARQLAAGDLHARVLLHGRHELAHLGHAFNHMADQLNDKIQSLRRSEARFRNYFELGLIGMAVTSPSKGWVEANDTLLEMFGYTLPELRATTWASLTHPDDLERDLQQFNRVLSGEIEGYKLEKRFIRKNGEVLHALLSIKCMRGRSGEVDYILALIDDITDRRAWEFALENMNRDLQSRVVEGRQELSATSEQLSSALARLESAQAVAIQTEKLSTIGSMVAAIAHELRNPLMGIINYVQYAQLCADPAQRAEVLGKADKGLHSLSRTVDNMLRFARPKEDRVEPLNPALALRAAVELIAADLRGRGISADLQLPPLGTVLGEESALQQVYLNLLINARDAVLDTAQPQIRIRGGTRERRSYIDVIDNGPGVDPGQEEQIFEPFVTTKPKGSGTGLGLAISRDILATMGGTLEYLRRAPGETVFRVELPLVRAESVRASHA